MKLLLTSEGITNKSIAKALSELLGKPFGSARAVYIPTAANPENTGSGWDIVEMNTVKNLGFLSFDVVDISEVEKQIWLPIFEKADVLAFAGGNEVYLFDWINKSGLRHVLPELLATKVYVGNSAGSMVTAKRISVSDIDYLYYEKEKRTVEFVSGLGFVDFEIRPHLDSPGFPKVRLDYLEKLAKENPTPFYALDDNSAVKVDGDIISVVSEGTWKKFN